MTKKDFQVKWFQLEDLLFGFAMKLTRNKDAAKDLMQETVFRAFRSRDRFKVNTNFKAWVTTIMRNTFINNYRKVQKRNQVEAPIEDMLYFLENKAGSGEADSSIKTKDLYKTLDTLSDTYRVPFLMFFQGYEYKEISEQLEIPIGTVKSRIYSARQNLKKVIAAWYGNRVRA